MSQEITVSELAKLIENGHPVRLIDVRQLWENQLARLEGSLHIPLNDLPHRTAEIPTDASALVIIYCHHGVRSLSAVNYLQRLGHHHVRSLAGGIDAWSCEVDPGIKRY